MSGRSIDHIVLTVRNLDAAAHTYEQLGFQLTPRAFHEERMGTSNHLAQFAGQNFIELLEVDRPDSLEPHDFSQVPPFFSFGAFNRSAKRDGVTMLVFASNDARQDIDKFKKAGVPTYAPFDFERLAQLPDGSTVTVAFSLAFATSPNMPETAFFVCQNRAREYFWKPRYQTHDNGAQSINAVYLVSDNPEREAAFISSMFDGDVETVPGGMEVSCGPAQSVRVLTPCAITALDADYQVGDYSSPVFAGIEISRSRPRATIPSSSAHGIFIRWSVT